MRGVAPGPAWGMRITNAWKHGGISITFFYPAWPGARFSQPPRSTSKGERFPEGHRGDTGSGAARQGSSWPALATACCSSFQPRRGPGRGLPREKGTRAKTWQGCKLHSRATGEALWPSGPLKRAVWAAQWPAVPTPGLLVRPEVAEVRLTPRITLIVSVGSGWQLAGSSWTTVLSAPPRVRLT